MFGENTLLVNGMGYCKYGLVYTSAVVGKNNYLQYVLRRSKVWELQYYCMFVWHRTRRRVGV